LTKKNAEEPKKTAASKKGPVASKPAVRYTLKDVDDVLANDDELDYSQKDNGDQLYTYTTEDGKKFKLSIKKGQYLIIEGANNVYHGGKDESTAVKKYIDLCKEKTE